MASARELIRPPFGIGLHPDRFERFADAAGDLGPGHFALLQSEGDILRNREMRPQGVTLEHHARIALMRGQPRDILVAKEDPAAVRDEKSRQAAQERRLAAAAGTEEEEEFARLDDEIEVVERSHRPKALGQFLDADGNHDRPMA